GVGIYAGGREENESDFLVGGRNVPWLAVLGSLIATEVSAATFLAVPGLGFGENMTYLQFGIGSILARFFVAAVFIGAFYNAGCMSIYEFLGKSFGPRSQYAGSLLFLATRLMASGVRLLIAAKGLSIIFGMPLHWVIIAFTLLTVIYTGYGGIKAVIWTDCVQAIVFIGAGIGALCYTVQVLGWDSFISAGMEGGRFEIFRLAPDGEGIGAWLSDSNILLMAVLFGFISTTAAMGTDQDLTQRLLSAKNAADARRSVALSGFIAIPIAALFLLVGVGLYGISGTPLGAALTNLSSNDAAFPRFITAIAPAGLRGLLVAGVLAAAMSSLDSTMAALSSSVLRDLIEPLTRREGRILNHLVISRGLVYIFAILLALIAWLFRDSAAFLWLAFQVTSVTYGVLLGVFLLGLRGRRGNDTGNMLAIGVGLLAAAISLTAIKMGWISIAWTWVIVIGASVTYAVGSAFRSEDRAARL
ncbi:MAG: sodium/solute symporter, partial [Pontiellaceae bacterium]|nr:sodium/solute symporter [Pontiellaceae bacterium]